MNKRPRQQSEKRKRTRRQAIGREKESDLPDSKAELDSAEEGIGMADNTPDNKQGTEAPQGSPAEAYVDEVARAETVLNEEYQKELQDTERKRRVDEAKRILARHREEQVKADPQLSSSNKEIMTHAAYAAGAALVTPRLLSPLIAVTSVAGVQLKMLNDMAKIFSVPFSEDSGKAFIASLTGSLGTGAIATPAVSGIMSLIPIVGPLASKLGYSAVAFGSTYAIGKVFQAHFASGGNLLNFDPIKARELYRAQLQVGARMAPSATPA
jgi:uncharacterized protein (DUF697 family)